MIVAPPTGFLLDRRWHWMRREVELRAGRDPARRRSKRLQDLADAHALIEQHTDLLRVLTASEREILSNLPD